MSATATYAPQVFDGLNDFKVAKQYIEGGKAKLDAVGAVICQHGVEQKVGIALLHKHFGLNPDEKLVEQFIGKHSYVKPTTSDEQIVPYTWKLAKDETTGGWRWFPLEFVKITDNTADVCKRAEMVASNEALMKDLADKLVELGVQDTLGLSVLHRELIPLNEGETLLETTDERNRMLTFTAIPKTNVDPEDMYETLWHFTPDSTVEDGAMMCSAHNHCSQHCTGHK